MFIHAKMPNPTSESITMVGVEKEVHRITYRTLETVPEPKKSAILTDFLIGRKRFCISDWWKFLYLEEKIWRS